MEVRIAHDSDRDEETGDEDNNDVGSVGGIVTLPYDAAGYPRAFYCVVVPPHDGQT